MGHTTIHFIEMGTTGQIDYVGVWPALNERELARFHDVFEPPGVIVCAAAVDSPHTRSYSEFLLRASGEEAPTRELASNLGMFFLSIGRGCSITYGRKQLDVADGSWLFSSLERVV